MKVYLARHGDAIPKEVDSECPLSEKGITDLKKMATFLSSCHLQVDFFFHSGKLRAEQTANLLSKGIKCKRGVEARNGLNPLDLVGPVAYEINQFENDLALVGHMPFMGKLLSKLIIDYEKSPELVLFQTAVLACLERQANGAWVLKWVLSPDLLNPQPLSERPIRS